MLVLEGKSRNRSVLQMESSKVVYWPPRSSPSSYISAMLDEAFRDMGDGVYIQSRQCADLFKVAHFRAKTKTTRILLFADDSALVAHSAEEMQKIVDAFYDASKKFGLKINRDAVPTQLYKNQRGRYHG